jgi:hypothetical protein
MAPSIGLATVTLFGFGHARLSISRSFDQQQPKGWLQWTSDGGNDGREHVHIVQAYPREPEHQDGDIDIKQTVKIQVVGEL